MPYRKSLVLVLLFLFACADIGFALANEEDDKNKASKKSTITYEYKHTTPQQAPTVQAGGFKQGLKTLFFGPRMGLEGNEGIKMTFVEKANLFVPLSPFESYGKNGIKGFLASAFLGPRVGSQLKERKIRKVEWLGLIPIAIVTFHAFSADLSTSAVIFEVGLAGLISRLIPSYEAYKGKTMTEVHRRENLGKN